MYKTIYDNKTEKPTYQKLCHMSYELHLFLLTLNRATFFYEIAN